MSLALTQRGALALSLQPVEAEVPPSLPPSLNFLTCAVWPSLGGLASHTVTWGRGAREGGALVMHAGC